jgi:hypothetical protein
VRNAFCPAAPLFTTHGVIAGAETLCPDGRQGSAGLAPGKAEPLRLRVLKSRMPVRQLAVDHRGVRAGIATAVPWTSVPVLAASSNSSCNPPPGFTRSVFEIRLRSALHARLLVVLPQMPLDALERMPRFVDQIDKSFRRHGPPPHRP